MNKISIVLTGIMLFTIPYLAHAEQPITGSGEWYYEIGGAEPISPSPNPAFESIVIDGSIGLSIGGACGDLDPVLSVSNILDDIKDGIDQFEDAMVLAANSAIAALPAIILQRANPGLYDHFQNAVLAAKARVDIATKTCEQIVQEAHAGQNPFDDWIRISRRYSWDQELEEEGNDPVSARDNVEEANGDAGVPWLGGDAGGVDQEPIRVIFDTTRAGYNVTLNRDAAAEGAPPIPDPVPRLIELWDSPEAAATWAVDVLGDQIVETSADSPKRSTSGAGLPPKYEEEKELVGPLLVDLVTGATEPTLENLQEVSAPSIIVSRQLIEAIRNTPDAQEQGIIIGKLAADIASSRVVERALTIRRLLITGMLVPEISSNTPAITDIEMARVTVEREIDNFFFESEIRKKLVSNTAMLVLDIETQRRTRSLQHPDTTAQDPDALIRGRVDPE